MISTSNHMFKSENWHKVTEFTFWNLEKFQRAHKGKNYTKHN